jgi:Zn-dependent protease
MNWQLLPSALGQYVGLVVVITLHEFGHAWMASRCGDNTARSLGRVTLNPLAHMDWIGTVVLPLLQITLTLLGYWKLAAFIIGWGKPVPVNYTNLRNVDRDSLLVAMAGPAMNVILTVVVAVLVKVTFIAGLKPWAEGGVILAYLSMYLFFFNLLPVPPLDGSHILRFVTRMSWETFFFLSRFGFVAVILLIQVPAVRRYLDYSTAWCVTNSLRVLGVE